MKLRRDITPMIQVLEHILKGMHTLDFSYSYEYTEGYCLDDIINDIKIYIEPHSNSIRLSRYYKGITLEWKPSSLKSLIFQLNVIDNEL